MHVVALIVIFMKEGLVRYAALLDVETMQLREHMHVQFLIMPQLGDNISKKNPNLHLMVFVVYFNVQENNKLGNDDNMDAQFNHMINHKLKRFAHIIFHLIDFIALKQFVHLVELYRPGPSLIGLNHQPILFSG